MKPHPLHCLPAAEPLSGHGKGTRSSPRWGEALGNPLAMCRAGKFSKYLPLLDSVQHPAPGGGDTHGVTLHQPLNISGLTLPKGLREGCASWVSALSLSVGAPPDLTGVLSHLPAPLPPHCCWSKARLQQTTLAAQPAPGPRDAPHHAGCSWGTEALHLPSAPAPQASFCLCPPTHLQVLLSLEQDSQSPQRPSQ